MDLPPEETADGQGEGRNAILSWTGGTTMPQTLGNEGRVWLQIDERRAVCGPAWKGSMPL